MESCTTTSENTVRVPVAKNVFDKEAVMSGAYRLTNKYSVEILEEASAFIVAFTPKNPLEAQTIDTDIANFHNDLLDEQLRLKLEEKSGKIRELIVRHAFSSLDLKKELGQNG